MCWGGLAVRACGCGQERLRGEVLGYGGGAGELTCRRLGGGEAGNRRGRQSHVNLQLSCSFFLQGKGTPNGRLRERAGRWDMLDAAWETSESALGQYYGR